MTGTVLGPARCVECGAVWQIVHVTLAEGTCIRCGGLMEELPLEVEGLRPHLAPVSAQAVSLPSPPPAA